MFKAFKKRKAEKEQALLLYQRLVEQARNADFYTELDVEDSLEGRFDMILLHVWLVDSCLETAGERFVRLRRYIQETLIIDLDRSFRELGVGDMSVGKEMKKVGAALLGRKQAYANAISKGKKELRLTLVKNVYRGKDIDSSEALADYVLRARKSLGESSPTNPVSVKLDFVPVLKG